MPTPSTRPPRKLTPRRALGALLAAGSLLALSAGAQIATARSSAPAHLAAAATPATGGAAAPGGTAAPATTTSTTTTSTTTTTTAAAPKVTASTKISSKAPLVATKSATVQTASGPNFLTGIGDEQTNMFTNPLWKNLHTKITRYIVPWDAVTDTWYLTLAKQWVAAAEKAGQQVLIAFYHSEKTPLKMPSVSEYRTDVVKFMKDLPNVNEYQPWNEANHGDDPHEFVSPDPMQSAEYYQVVKRACTSCTVVGLDFQDQENVAPTIRYIDEFKRDIVRLHVAMPKLWGLHNYSDTNRYSESRTEAILKVVPGTVWLTETGGLVKFGGAFPNKHGEGLTRAAKALQYMFRIAKAHRRITRLYIYDWSGGNSKTTFDAGLTDINHKPRPGYVVVCKQLHAKGCNVKTSKV